MTFDQVAACGLSLPNVELSTKYDGSPVLKVHGSFMAGLAMHESAEPETLVVRYGIGDRDRLMDEASETYYLTDYYRPYPLVLARLGMLRADALRDLLSVSWQLAVEKTGKPPR
jgi:hypothetical protein